MGPTVKPIQISEYNHVVVLTGAGVSAASGVPTFRGTDGLWNDPKVERLSYFETFLRRPADVWEFWGWRRKALAAIEPNATHYHLAELEETLSAAGPQRAARFTLITQNVDGLHVRAGSKNVVEIHGRLTRTRCSDRSCSFSPIEDDYSYEGGVPCCPVCGQNLRLDIVMFGENLGPEAYKAQQALREADLFVAIGTSGTVYPAAGYVRTALQAGARTVYINLEPLDESNPFFHDQFVGPAEELVPRLLIP